jgi:hypothetical protein
MKRKSWALAVAAFGLAAVSVSGCAGKPEVGIGSAAPDFVLPESGGGEVGLGDFEGRPVLLYFHMALG